MSCVIQPLFHQFFEIIHAVDYAHLVRMSKTSLKHFCALNVQNNLQNAHRVRRVRGMRKEVPKKDIVPYEASQRSNEANAFVLSVAAEKNITPQDALALIVETVARGKKNVTRNINAKKKEEVEA